MPQLAQVTVKFKLCRCLHEGWYTRHCESVLSGKFWAIFLISEEGFWNCLYLAPIMTIGRRHAEFIDQATRASSCWVKQLYINWPVTKFFFSSADSLNNITHTISRAKQPAQCSIRPKLLRSTCLLLFICLLMPHSHRSKSVCLWTTACLRYSLKTLCSRFHELLMKVCDAQ